MKEGPHRSTLSPRPSPLRCRSYSYPSGARILVTHGLGLTTSLRRESRFLRFFSICHCKKDTLAAFSFRVLTIRVKIQN